MQPLADGKQESNTAKSDGGIFNRLYPFGLLDEAKTLVKITIPFAFGNVLQSWFISFVSLVFMGQLGPLERNACALALSTYVLIGNSLMLGKCNFEQKNRILRRDTMKIFDLSESKFAQIFMQPI